MGGNPNEPLNGTVLPSELDIPDPPAPRPEAVGGYAVAKPTIWQRLGFLHAWAPNPGVYEDMRPQESWDWPKGYIMVDVVGALDWRDRLRALVSGRVSVQVKVRTDVVVSRSIATSGIAVLPPGAS